MRWYSKRSSFALFPGIWKSSSLLTLSTGSFSDFVFLYADLLTEIRPFLRIVTSSRTSLPAGALKAFLFSDVTLTFFSSGIPSLIIPPERSSPCLYSPASRRYITWMSSYSPSLFLKPPGMMPRSVKPRRRYRWYAWTLEATTALNWRIW